MVPCIFAKQDDRNGRRVACQKLTIYIIIIFAKLLAIKVYTVECDVITIPNWLTVMQIFFVKCDANFANALLNVMQVL